jgi:Flp pilus assembly protein TadD
MRIHFIESEANAPKSTLAGSTVPADQNRSAEVSVSRRIPPRFFPIPRRSTNQEEQLKVPQMYSSPRRIHLRNLAPILVLVIVPNCSVLSVYGAGSANSKPFNSSSESKSPTNAPSALEERYRERATSNPNDAEAFEGLAILQMKHGEFPGAVESYRRVLALTPKNRDARLGLGRTLALSGQYPAAVKHYRQMLAENPHDGDALEGMAQVHLWSGHPEWALPIFTKLASDHPGNSDDALGLARTQIRLHQYSAARSTLAAVLKTHPHLHDAELQLADLDIYEGHLAGA